MKVLWLCHFSNPKVRKKIQLSYNIINDFISKYVFGSSNVYTDFAQWITNGIEEFEKFDDVEMHVISPHRGMKKKIESFQLNRIKYYFYKPDDNLLLRGLRKLTNRYETGYRGNRKNTRELIDQIKPDIIHMYGVENPYYSITALDIDIKKYPFFVSLQTLMSEDNFKKKQRGSKRQYDFRVSIEKKILSNVCYIGSSIEEYRKFVWNNINPHVVFFNTYLAIAEETNINSTTKKYDFVYFAANISKAADLAVEAFAIASKKYSNITLNIIGGTPQPYSNNLKARITELGLEGNVFFSGRLATHNDVLNQIKLSKYALLPLRIDIISGTIREAMFSGLPVISTITLGTPSLNKKRQSVLLSKQDDHQAMAENMILLVENPKLALRLSKNGLKTVQEEYNNKKEMQELVNVYSAIINHHKNGVKIPSELGTKNPNKCYAK